MSKKNIILLLTGDIMLGGEFTEFKENRHVDYEYPFDGVKKLFEEADIVFGNLECTLSKTNEVRQDKSMTLYSPPDSIQALKYLGYNIISLGNNHINDYGEQGLVKTIKILGDSGISCFGAGRNLGEARKAVFIETKGLRFAFLGYTTDESHVSSIIASSNRAGCVYYDLPRIEQDIVRARSKADIICISLHWGYEHQIYPSPKQVTLAHRVIEAGADIIIGHHPHLVQGFEKYKQGVIFYSLGNFFFPNYYDKLGIIFRWSEESDRFIIARCEIDKAKVGEIEIFPGFRNEDHRVIILQGKDKERAIFEIGKLSLPIKRGDYKSFWRAYVKKRQQEKLHNLLQRVKELGVKGCIGKVTIGNIKAYGGMLLRYLLMKS